MTYYNPEEIADMIEKAVSPNSGRPDVGLLLATQAQAAATLYLAEQVERIANHLEWVNYNR